LSRGPLVSSGPRRRTIPTSTSPGPLLAGGSTPAQPGHHGRSCSARMDTRCDRDRPDAWPRTLDRQARTSDRQRHLPPHAASATGSITAARKIRHRTFPSKPRPLHQSQGPMLDRRRPGLDQLLSRVAWKPSAGRPLGIARDWRYGVGPPEAEWRCKARSGPARWIHNAIGIPGYGAP
jgi:hypothetical protein